MYRPKIDGMIYLTTSNLKTPPVSASTTNVRVAPYLLDRKKQISKLANDASIDDFEIVVSPTEHNVNIFCSTGFYSLFAVPAFSSITTSYSAVTAGVTVSWYGKSKGKCEHGLLLPSWNNSKGKHSQSRHPSPSFGPQNTSTG